MKVIITTMDNLPEYCHDCPCCHDGYCKADKERREAQPYRPFWCPLREEKEEEMPNTEEKICVTKCDRCGKILARKSLTTIVKIAHGGTSTVNYPHNGEFTICKNCEQWLINELAPF